MGVHEPGGSANAEMDLLRSGRHDENVPWPGAPRGHPAEMLAKCCLDFHSVVAAKTVIPPDGSALNTECGKHDADAIEPTATPPLRTESGADEPTGALGIVDRHALKLQDIE
jgi:hypothetical protein